MGVKIADGPCAAPGFAPIVNALSSVSDLGHVSLDCSNLIGYKRNGRRYDKSSKRARRSGYDQSSQ